MEDRSFYAQRAYDSGAHNGSAGTLAHREQHQGSCTFCDPAALCKNAKVLRPASTIQPAFYLCLQVRGIWTVTLC